MIEAEKMLYLRRYLTLIRLQLRPPRYENTRNYSSYREGYVLKYVHSRHTNLRPETYVTTCGFVKFSTLIPQSSPSDIVDHKLLSFCNDVKKGEASAEGLKQVIDLCTKSDYQLPHDTGILLLKCCGSLLSDLKADERNHLVSQIWHLVKRNDGTLTLEHYNTLLGINEENSKFVNPKKFLEDMSVKPDENTYRLLLSTAIKTGNKDYLSDILFTIKDKNIYEKIANILAQICTSSDNIIDLEQMISLMQEAKLSTNEVYTELACRYAKLGDIPNLIKILNEEPQSNLNLLKIIKILSISNNSRHIPVVLNFLMASVPEIQPEISSMIVELIRADRVADAHTVINCFAMNNVTTDVIQNFVNTFMNELIMTDKSADHIIKYRNDFIDSGYSQHTLTDIAEIGIKLLRTNLCLDIFREMKNKNMEVRPHYYWPLLMKAHHDKGEAEIYSLLKYMMNNNVEVDSDTLLNYVFPYVNTSDPITTIKRLILNDLPGAITYTPLLLFLLRANRLQDVILLCSFYGTRFKIYYKELIKPLVRAYIATKDTKSCVTLLTASPQGKDFASYFLNLLINPDNPIYIEDLQFFLDEFKNYKIKISQEDAKILAKKLKENKNFNVTAKLVILINELIDPESTIFLLQSKQYMSTKELEYFLVELKSKKRDIKNILQKLLMAYCMEKKLKKAEEIKQEYDALKYEWTPTLKSILFELYLKCDKLKEAEALLSDLNIMPGEYQLDRQKIIVYATALVRADNITKAFDVIDTIVGINSKIDTHLYCYLLLETLAHSKHHAHTKNMLELLLKKKFCNISEDLLIPLVAIPLEHNNILDAVDILIKNGKEYSKMPFTIEILAALLELKQNSELPNATDYIEQIYNVAAQVYSVKVANTFLAIALAMVNETEKLENLLKNHDLSMNCLIYHNNHTKNINVIDGTKNLLKVIDTDSLEGDGICLTLLANYSKIGDYNRALELWEIMCTKNIKPSEKFEKRLISFLSSNKISLPPELKNKSNSES